MPHVWFALEVDEEGWPPVEAEEVHAEKAGDGRFRLTGIPVFVMGVAPGDVVEVDRDQKTKQRWVTSVVETAGWWVSRVVPKTVNEDTVVERFQNLGVTVQLTDWSMVALAIPPEIKASKVLALLRDGAARGDWYFDLGVDPEA